MDGARSGRAQLAFPFAILLALAATLALAGPDGAPAPSVAAPQTKAASNAPDRLDPHQLARISVGATPAVARRVERIRGLSFDSLPKPEVVGSRYLNRLGLREVERQGGELGLGRDDAVGAITGLLSPGERLEAAYTSTGDLAAAAYDPKRKRLYIVRDAVVANRALVEFVLAHELDHALEDQRFGLPEGGRNDDAALAHQALAEGSATALMIDYGARYLDPLALVSAAQGIDTGTGNVPKAFVDQLTWSYLGGARLISSLRALDRGWRLVDYAINSRPPATTEQVLHPDKYLRDELPSTVRIDPREPRARGWRPADRGVFGELPTSYLLRVGADPEVARTAAAGWDGDRYELWRRDVAPGACAYPCRSEFLLVARWSWDSPTDAREFDRAAATYVERGLNGRLLSHGLWSIDDGAVALAAGRRESTLTFAPGEAGARAIAAAQ